MGFLLKMDAKNGEKKRTIADKSDKKVVKEARKEGIDAVLVAPE